VALVEKLLAAEGTEDEQKEWLRLVEANVPHPAVSDLIYYSDVALSAEEIVELVLNYSPIGLPGAGSDDKGRM
jgi:hypothetical protein